MTSVVVNRASMVALAVVMGLSAGAGKGAAPPRPTTADGAAYPDAGFCTLALNLPVVHAALGGLPEAVGLRKVFSVKSADPVVKNWVAHLAANKIDAGDFDYVGPGVDYGAECVLLGVNDGRVDRLLFFFPRLTEEKAVSFTDPIHKVGVADPTSQSGHRFQVNGVTLIDTPVGGHSTTVAHVDPSSTHQNYFVREPNVTYQSTEHPSGVLLRVAPVDWYLATHVLAAATAAAIRDGRPIKGMTPEQAVVALGDPEGRSTDESGRETLAWHGLRRRADGNPERTRIVATFDKAALVSFTEDECR